MDSESSRMAQQPIFVLPGDVIESSYIPSHPKKPLRIGPGLRHVPPTEILPTLAGQLVSDSQKNTIRVENLKGRYTPRAGELVIGTVNKSAAEMFQVHLSDHTSPAMLPQLSFEGATKKTRPQLQAGALVYARIAVANKHMDPEIECVSSATGKADGLGPLQGGMLFKISQGMARKLLMPKSLSGSRIVVLDELADAGLQFETASGRNGRFWVDSESLKTIIAVGKAIQETDEQDLGIQDQKKLVRKLVKIMSNT